MYTLYESIKSLCDQAGVTGGKMCVDLKISKSTMTDLKTGRRSGISLETAQKIADYFEVSVDRVLGSEPKEKSPVPNSTELTEQQKIAYKLIASLSMDDLNRLIRIAEIMKTEDDK